MADWVSNFRYAIRVLLKNPGFTLTTVLTLALGIGTNVAIFSLINSVLLRPLPFDHGDRIVQIQQQTKSGAVRDVGFSPTEVEDLRSQIGAFNNIVESHTMAFNMMIRNEPQRLEAAVVSWQYFDVLGVRPLIGRTFEETDERQGADSVFLISQAYWQRVFGGDPKILGEKIEMNGRLHTVIGVLPSFPQHPKAVDIYMPTTSCPFRSGANWRNNRAARGLTVLGKIQQDQSLTEARTDTIHVIASLQQQHPEAYSADLQLTPTIVPLAELMTENAKSTFLFLAACGGCVLLIICTNLANLVLSRHIRREKEILIRMALGAGRKQIAQQLVTEGVLVSLVGGGLGFLAAFVSMDLLKTFAARFTPRAQEISVDLSVLLFALAISILVGIALGLLPVLRSQQSVALDLRSLTTSVTASVRNQRLRSILVVAQVAASFVLLVGAGLMLRTLVHLQEVDATLAQDNILTLRVDLNWSKYTNPELIRNFSDQLAERLKQAPGVNAVTFTNAIPLSDGPPADRGFQKEDQILEQDSPRPQADFQAVSDDYFPIIGIPLIQGRTFDTRDRHDAAKVVVINQTMAKMHWANENPLGRRISLDRGKTWNEIIGVVADVRTRSLKQAALAQIYGPFRTSPIRDMRLMIQGSVPPAQIVPAIKSAVQAIDPTQPVTEIRLLSEVRAESIAPTQLTANLLGFLGFAALTITGIGLAGVMALIVSQRTKELAIRIALGASTGQVIGLITRYAATLLTSGLLIGVIIAVLLNKLLENLLFGIQGIDVFTFIAVGILLFTVGGLACLLPALQAIRVNPVIALRADQ